jgi:hypothetical protein
MTLLDWLGRALCLVVTFGAAYAKGTLYQPESALLSVAISQCLSAFCNAIAVVAAAYLVRGRASYELQLLAYCAVVVNLLSFISYAAKISPMVHALNLTITVISYAQLARLLWPRNDSFVDYCISRLFLLSAAPTIKNLHVEKEKT